MGRLSGPADAKERSRMRNTVLWVKRRISKSRALKRTDEAGKEGKWRRYWVERVESKREGGRERLREAERNREIERKRDRDRESMSESP